MQQVLILNAGSSSLKWLVLEADSETVRQEGAASWQGMSRAGTSAKFWQRWSA
jgi:acetate kinase